MDLCLLLEDTTYRSGQGKSPVIIGLEVSCVQFAPSQSTALWSIITLS